jgi:deoxyribonuclease-4
VKKALDHAAEIGAESVQLFVQSPRMWKFPNHDPKDVAAFRGRREELGIGAVVVHALYLCNLASPNDEVYEKSVATMKATMDASSAIGAEAVIFHVGSHLGTGFEAGLERVVPAMEQILEHATETTWLLMENSAGAGGTIGRSLDELATLYDACSKHERLGVCLDSCHLWVSGYDVTDRKAFDGLLRDVDQRIGLHRLRALHVNDAQAALGSNKDRHANVLDGEMGEGLGVFVGHPKVQALPAVMETPGPDGHGPDAGEMKKLRELHARALA